MDLSSIRTGRTSPLASSHDVLVRRCTQALETRGVAWRPLVRSHGLRLSEEPVPGARIATRSERALLHDAERIMDDPFLGWSLGAFEMRDLGVFGYAALNAPTLRASLDVIIELFALLSEGPQLVLHVADGEATLAEISDLGTCMNQVGLRMMLAHLHELAGPEVAPLRVGLPEADPVRLQGLSDRIGLPVKGMAVPLTFVTFDADLLERPLHQADARLADALRRIWDEERQRLADRGHILARLQQAVIAVLPGGEPKLQAVADHLLMPVEALRRELHALGTNLRQVTDMVRDGLVGGLLAEPGMTLERAARALGYGEPKSLTRALARWRGAAPVASYQRSPGAR
ncbi:MAG: AraC family transcriptional regulator ligand-binding domain-containing protein [Geminicoccaceae bacterium]